MMHPMFSDDLKEIVESFVVETGESFEELDQDLIQLEQNADDKELINKIFRAVHTVKGASGFLGFDQMSTLAHHFEDVLNKLRRDELTFESTMLNKMLDAFDLMKTLLQQVIDKKIQDIELDAAINQLAAISTGSAQNAVAEDAVKSAGVPQPAAEPPEVTAPHDDSSRQTAENTGSETTADDSHPMFAADMVEIVESFVIETQESFEQLDQDLLLLEHNAADKELINKVFRAVHTVKGASGFLGFDQMSALAHRFESVLNKLRHDELMFESWMLDTLFDAFDLMKTLLQQVVDKAIRPIEIDDMLNMLTAISNNEMLPGSTPGTAGQTTPDRTARSEASGKTTAGEAPEKSDHPASEASVPPAERKPEKKADTTIRVDVQRLDSLMNLVGELVLGRNRLSQLVDDIALSDDKHDCVHELVDTSTQIDFITTELQAAVMKTRMVQVGRIFNRFPRLVRDISREFSKDIDLVIEGQETEMDKSVIEEIGDPLIHLIRNAVDHGIESPAERQKQGKPQRGRIRLAAYHEGNHVVVMVEDDGSGIDVEKIKNKAIEKGLISTEAAAEMSTTEAFDLLFMPGFSTAGKITSISGRGVGMDVVKTNITRLSGMVIVETAPGEGSRFLLKVPLTLAIIQGLLVNIGTEIFAVPLSSVVEVVRTSHMEVNRIQGREVIRLREEVLRLVRINEMLEIPGRPHDETHFYTVIIAAAKERFGLVVDKLYGQKEIVVKPLGSYLKSAPGIAGSTILGDGQVIMILDPGEIAQLMQNQLETEA